MTFDFGIQQLVDERVFVAAVVALIVGVAMVEVTRALRRK
jgi:hypothetical protein